MSSSATEISDGFKIADAASYDNHIEKFDELTQRYTNGIARQLVALANPKAGQTILDVSCGTGVVALTIALDYSPGTVIGLDLSAPMLARAAQQAAQLGVGSRTVFRQGDAESLPFGAHHFDRVVSLYALRHFPDPQRALEEMCRVVKPGGVIAIGVGSAPPAGSLKFLIAGARKLGKIAATLVGRAPLLAPQSLDQFIDRHWGATAHHEEAHWTRGVSEYSRLVDRMMRKVGLVSVTSHWFGAAASIETAEDFWSLQSTLSTYARKRLATASASEVEELRVAYLAYCRFRMRKGSRLVFRSGALITRGVRAQADR